MNFFEESCLLCLLSSILCDGVSGVGMVLLVLGSLVSLNG